MKDTIIEAWKNGMTIEDIADEFGYDETKILEVLEEEHLISD